MDLKIHTYTQHLNPIRLLKISVSVMLCLYTFLFCSKDVQWNFYLFFWRVIVSFTDGQIFLYLWKDILFVLGSRNDCELLFWPIKVPRTGSPCNYYLLASACKSSWSKKCTEGLAGRADRYVPFRLRENKESENTQSEESQKNPKGKQRTAVPWRKTLHFKSIESLCFCSGRFNLHCWIYNFFIVLNSLSRPFVSDLVSDLSPVL